MRNVRLEDNGTWSQLVGTDEQELRATSDYKPSYCSAKTTTVLHNFSRGRMSDQKPTGDFSTRQIVEALALLAKSHKRGDQPRFVPLARFGSYEVRLLEVSAKSTDPSGVIWMELYALDIQHTLDSCSCRNVAEAAHFAKELTLQAIKLNDN